MIDLKDGDRIRMVKMGDDPLPIKVGDTGTVFGNGVKWADGTTQYNVKWDSGRTLGVILPVDTVEKI